ncbi:MAG: phage terminase large subunit, partial [Gemmiger sp.]
MTCKLSELISPAFYEPHRAVKAGIAQEVLCKGGRGSAKSSYLSIELVLQLLRHPDCHAVALRKVAGTLRTSVYAQICWAIGALGLTRYFKCTVSHMECVYQPTGQKILFFGTDDPGKLKSIKVPFGYVGILW